MALGIGDLVFVEKLENKVNDGGMPQTHIHDYYEMYYLVAGKRRYFIDHSLYDVEPGDIILVNRGDIHKTVSLEGVENYERYLLNFSEEFVKKAESFFPRSEFEKIFLLKKMHIPKHHRRNFNALVIKLTQECDAGGYKKQLALVHMTELLISLSRFADEKTLRVSDYLTTYENNIQNVCHYICNNYNKPISLEDIAKIAYMSPTYFSKKFRKVTGFGFSEYLNNVRIKMAIDMLLETNYSITEIAMNCGYQDSNYFGDVFKRVMNMAPSTYRKRYSN